MTNSPETSSQPSRSQRQFNAIVFGGLSIASILLVGELLSITMIHSSKLAYHEIFDLNRNAQYLVIVSWSLALPASQSGIWRAFSVICFLLIVLVVSLSESQAAQLALFVAPILGLLVAFFPRACRWLFAMLAIGVLMFPWSIQLVGSKIPIVAETAIAKRANTAHRIAIWEGYTNLITQKPVFGWGMKADRALGLNGQAAKVAKAKGFPDQAASPHNFILEIWVNLGLIGASLVALLMLQIGWHLSNLPRLQMAVATQICVSVYTISLIGSSLMQGWWLASIGMAVVVYTTNSNQELPT